jgi:hypothetical protein
MTIHSWHACHMGTSKLRVQVHTFPHSFCIQNAFLFLLLHYLGCSLTSLPFLSPEAKVSILLTWLILYFFSIFSLYYIMVSNLHTVDIWSQVFLFYFWRLWVGLSLKDNHNMINTHRCDNWKSLDMAKCPLRDKITLLRTTVLQQLV